MAKQTAVDPAQVEKQATMHENIRDDINKQLVTLKAHTDHAMQISTSEMTKHMSAAAERWVTSVQKSFNDHLTAMAGNIRAAAKDQADTDSANVQAINKIPVDTAGFLGG